MVQPIKQVCNDLICNLCKTSSIGLPFRFSVRFEEDGVLDAREAPEYLYPAVRGETANKFALMLPSLILLNHSENFITYKSFPN